MLAQARLGQQLRLREILVTRVVDNLGSRRVIEANDGALARIVDGEVHYWLPPPNKTPEPRPPRRRPMSDEAEIRALIERWAEAVHTGDMDGVLAGHPDDIVMFDVPPPEDGVRGIQAYRETWPPFFEWQLQGAAFEIVSLEVTAGAEVAFAHALLRCGTAEEFKQDPDNRLRLTIGLRKEGGRWVVAHEHHSFPNKSPA
jgi:uncharacterized protein (TIGR02246 family)